MTDHFTPVRGSPGPPRVTRMPLDPLQDANTFTEKSGPTNANRPTNVQPFEASGPPTVTRVNLQTTRIEKDVGKLQVPVKKNIMPVSSAGGDVSLEQTMLASSLDNLWSLPEVVSKVAVQQRSHSQEIGAQRERLEQLENHLKEEKEILGDLTHEIQALNRKVVSSQGLYSQKKKDGQQLQKELTHMLQVNTDLECQLEAERRKIQQFQDTVVKTQTKMADHRVATQRVVIDNPQEVEKRKLLDDIEQLKSQKESGVSVSHKKPLLDAITSTKQKHEALSNELQEKKNLLQSLKIKHTDTKKEISVLHKRNAAQLRRLKSQVREIQLQQRQWSDEATRLEDCISKMKQ